MLLAACVTLPMSRRLLGSFLPAGFLFILVVLSLSVASAQTGIPYEVAIEGVDEELLTLLQRVSNTTDLQDRPPATLNLLRRRVNEDVPEFIRALRSRSYYGAQVRAEIDAKSDPVRVTFHVDPGPPYLIESVDIQLADEKKEFSGKLPDPHEVGLIRGEPGDARVILNAESQLLEELRKRAFPFPEVADRNVTVDHAGRSMTVVFRIDPGPSALFGSTTITGLTTVEEDFIQGRLPWERGDPFDAELLSKAHDRLVLTRLFSRIQVNTGESVDEEGFLPISVGLMERRHRTVRVGARYGTDEGFGGRVAWEHRNFFGRGESVVAEVTVSEISYVLEGQFGKPAFLRDDQSLLFRVRVAEDDPDGYTSRNVSTSLVVERLLRQGMTVGGGVAFKAASIEQFGETNEYALLFIPTYFNWDTSDDLLNPTRGGRINLQLTPFYDTLRMDLGFIRQYLSYSRYFQVSESPSVILAGRGALGAMAGVSRDEIPADERFYAGGGGSIRGYGFQSVGPLEGDEPIGGRSLLELSLEVRYRVTETIGLVAFLDGGSAFESEYPDFDSTIRWGTGLGFRYFTPVGPLRLDVAFPLNRRAGVDDAFQVYLSIGQAF